MDREPDEFETFLKQFQPRKPRALAEPNPPRHQWAHWAWAAAIIILACGGTVLIRWRSAPAPRLAAVKTERPLQQTPTAAQAVTVGALSRFLQTPDQLDEVLTDASRKLLPHVEQPDNPLHILAKD
jgi:hypothetical protein